MFVSSRWTRFIPLYLVNVFLLLIGCQESDSEPARAAAKAEINLTAEAESPVLASTLFLVTETEGLPIEEEKAPITRLDLPPVEPKRCEEHLPPTPPIVTTPTMPPNSTPAIPPKATPTVALNETGITLIGDKTLYLEVGSTFQEPGAVAMDSKANNISSKMTIESDLNIDDKNVISQTGFFNIQYRVTDNTQSPPVDYKATREVVVRQATCSSRDDRDCLKLAEHHSQRISDFPKGKNLDNAVKINASRIQCTAPCGVHFEAALLQKFWQDEKPSLLNAFNEVAYHWDFGDEYAEFVSLNDDFRFSRSSNYAQGPYAAHVFAYAGSYEVRLKIADKTGRASETVVDIVVETPESQYPNEKTLCFSSSNQFDGCPQQAQQFTQWDQVAKIMNDRPKSAEDRVGYRLLFRAGDQFRATQTIHLRDGPYLINRFGPGKNPKILLTQNMDVFSAMKTQDVTIANIDAKGTYDPTTGYGDTYLSHFIDTTLVDDVTIFRTHTSGFGMHALLTGGNALVVADNSATDWHDYGSLCNIYDVNNNGRLDHQEFTRRVAYIGNKFRQNPAAVSGPGGKNGQFPHWADHGPIRAAGSFKMVISQNDLASTTGWSSDGQGHQPALRYNQSGPAKHSGVINQNQFKGGYHVVALSTQNPNTRAYLGHVLFERNFILGTSNTMYMMRVSYGNTIIRNNLAVMPDVSDDGLLLPFTHMIEIGFGTSSQANMRAEKHIFGNTFLNLQSNPSTHFSPFGKSLISKTHQNKYKTSRNVMYSTAQPNGINIDNIDIDSGNLKPIEKRRKRKKSKYDFHEKGLFDTYTGYKRNE